MVISVCPMCRDVMIHLRGNWCETKMNIITTITIDVEKYALCLSPAPGGKV